MSGRLFAADDWGFSPAINDGVLRLAREGWLASVSCAANTKFLNHGLEELLSHGQSGVKFSLHLNFTYGRPLLGAAAVPSLCERDQFVSHRELMRRSWRGHLDPAEITAEFRAQLKCLREAGIPVTSVDGHHHIHLLPAIARVLVDVLPEEGLREIRVLNDRAHLPSWLQTQYFKLRLARANPKLNLTECHYLRPRHLRAKARFARKLARSAGHPLLVHPALENDFQASGMTDGLRDYRVHELKTILNYMTDVASPVTSKF